MAIYRYIGGKSTWVATEGNIDLISTKESINLSSNQYVKLRGYNEGIAYNDYNWEEDEKEYEKEGLWLILHSAKKKGRNKDDTGTALDMISGDYIPEDAGLKRLERELIEEELVSLNNNYFVLGDKNEKAKKFAKKRIEIIKSFLKKTDKELFYVFRDKIQNYSRGDLENVAIDIVNKMQTNKGGKYSHKALNYAVKNHHSFVNFAEQVEFYLAKQISNGKKIEDLTTTLETPADKHFFYNILKDENVGRPQFSSYYDALNGLKILTNDIWAYEVYILGYYKNHNILSIDLRYNLYDHFGLDYPDIHKFNQDIFYSWFVLQHFRNYKPLITNIEIERTYRMIVPKNW